VTYKQIVQCRNEALIGRAQASIYLTADVHAILKFQTNLKEHLAGPEKWKKNHDYRKRNLVETVFSMMKLRFRGSLSSRGWMERQKELLMKGILHNIERLSFLECTGR
jgi:transposase